MTRLNLAQNELISIPPSVSLLENLGTLILRENKHLKEVSMDFSAGLFVIRCSSPRFLSRLVQCRNCGISICTVVDNQRGNNRPRIPSMQYCRFVSESIYFLMINKSSAQSAREKISLPREKTSAVPSCRLHRGFSLNMLGNPSTGMIDITKEPMSSFISNNYRTVEIIAYLKSLCDE